MPILQLREFPQELYDRLSALAESERRSLTQQAIVLLEEALIDKAKRMKKLEAIERFNEAQPHFKGITVEDVVTSIREDRDK